MSCITRRRLARRGWEREETKEGFGFQYGILPKKYDESISMQMHLVTYSMKR